MLTQIIVIITTQQHLLTPDQKLYQRNGESLRNYRAGQKSRSPGPRSQTGVPSGAKN